jgi:hypothetical protein
MVSYGEGGLDMSELKPCHCVRKDCVRKDGNCEKCIQEGWERTAKEYTLRPLTPLEKSQAKKAEAQEELEKNTTFVLGEPLNRRPHE